MISLIAVVLVGAVVIAGVFWLARVARDLQTQSVSALAEIGTDSAKQISERTADVDRRLATLGETLDRRLGQLDTKVDRRLESAQKTSAEIHERLGKV